MKSVAEKRKITYGIVTAGLMAALVFVGNFISVPMPFDARVHIGNSMCLLAGLLFGGVTGGTASGLGGAMYDLFNPVYITSAPFTFINKFAMGWTTGVLNRCGVEAINSMENKILRIIVKFVKTILVASAGQIVYIILYLGKSFASELIKGNALQTALVVIGVKAQTSIFNGVIAVIVSIPLYFAIKAALEKTPIGKYMIIGNNKKAEAK